MLRKKFDGLLFIQLIFSITVLFISIFSLITDTFELLPLMFIIMCAMFIFIGIREYKRTRNLLSGIIYFFVSLLMLFVAVKGIVL